MQVIYEDNHLLAVVKPPGLATQGTAAGQDSLLRRAKQYLKQKYNKPGNVYVGVVMRLDAPVTGVVLLARTSKAAARLNRQFHDGRVVKQYWAIVSGQLRPSSGTLRHWLWKDDRAQRMLATESPRETAKLAVLDYQTLAADQDVSLLEIRLHTGRKHQIRVQLASAGHPILGDRKYGSQAAWPAGIALHAYRLVLEHPVQKTPLELVAPLPPVWKRLAIAARLL